MPKFKTASSRPRVAAIGAALLASAALAAPAAAQITAYGVTANGALFSFDPASPAAVTDSPARGSAAASSRKAGTVWKESISSGCGTASRKTGANPARQQQNARRPGGTAGARPRGGVLRRGRGDKPESYRDGRGCVNCGARPRLRERLRLLRIRSHAETQRRGGGAAELPAA